MLLLPAANALYNDRLFILQAPSILAHWCETTLAYTCLASPFHLASVAVPRLRPTCLQALISKFQGYSAGKLDAKIRMAEKKIKAAEDLFTGEVDKLQAKHKALTADKDAKIAQIKRSGLGYMKAVKAAKK